MKHNMKMRSPSLKEVHLLPIEKALFLESKLETKKNVKPKLVTYMIRVSFVLESRCSVKHINCTYESLSVAVNS